ncbi:hypothetical protein [Breoghania sp.]|uniref:hypothetical protein n=1 Tax=Breoghania sp. TaxID=2065378 RepID=UPI002AA790BD|nr:hypothetical protein [Breoghania sp.]
MTFAKPTDAKTARQFLQELHDAGLLYHPEERAADCLSFHKLSTDRLAEIERNMRATFDYLDPCAVAVELTTAD